MLRNKKSTILKNARKITESLLSKTNDDDLHSLSSEESLKEEDSLSSVEFLEHSYSNNEMSSTDYIRHYDVNFSELSKSNVN